MRMPECADGVRGYVATYPTVSRLITGTTFISRVTGYSPDVSLPVRIKDGGRKAWGSKGRRLNPETIAMYSSVLYSINLCPGTRSRLSKDVHMAWEYVCTGLTAASLFRITPTY